MVSNYCVGIHIVDTRLKQHFENIATCVRKRFIFNISLLSNNNFKISLRHLIIILNFNKQCVIISINYIIHNINYVIHLTADRVRNINEY